MAISLRLNEEEASLIKAYASLKRLSVSEVIRQTMLEKIEDEYDLQVYEKAMKAYARHPNMTALADVEKELELT